MTARVDKDQKLINFVRGRRGRTSILDCLLTALSPRNSKGSWPECTFDELRERVSSLRLIEVPETTIRSVVYRADVFERASTDSGRVRWKLNAKGRQIVTRASRNSQ